MCSRASLLALSARLLSGCGLVRGIAEVPTYPFDKKGSFEREIRVVQRWRRQVPTQNWYVTPDFDTLLGPAGG